MDQRADFVRRRWCLWLAIALVAAGAVMNLAFLFGHSPFDLSEDESHYWEWSRHLDYGYYSKPPGIAWVIWAAVKMGRALGLGGGGGGGGGVALMPVVRTPAVIFGLMSGLLSLFLARRMFRDDRAALTVILLSAAVPMFAVGGLLITIDSPMYLCWSAAVYCLWRAVEKVNAQCGMRHAEIPTGKASGWAFWVYFAGIACAVGMMFKPVLIAVPICAVIGALWDGRHGALRRVVLGWHGLGALVLVLLSQVPVVMWNAHHGWVTFRHIGAQGGITSGEGGGAAHFNMAASVVEFIGGQAGGMGGAMFVLLVIAVVLAWKAVRRAGREISGGRIGAYRFLLAFTLPLWVFYLLLSFRKGTQVNWPAASYFAGMILLAGIMTEEWNSTAASTRRWWRRWGTATIVWGVLLTGVLMNVQHFYPLAASHLEKFKGSQQYVKSLWYPGHWDPAMKKLRGFEERAAVVESLRAALARDTGQSPFIVTSRYDVSSSLSFYLPGQPFVYCIMSSLDRGNQYDLWPGPDEKGLDGHLVNAGRPALVIGGFDAASQAAIVRPAFEKLEGPEEAGVWYHGVMIGEVTYFKGYGFKGFPEKKAGGW